MKNKKFYQQANFYAAACAFAFVTVALGLYAGNCASEFNGGTVSSAAVAGDVAAMILIAASLAGCVAASLSTENSVLAEIAKYRRFCLYAAFCAVIYSFLSVILAEYSLLGTILYPIVSGTEGDPVDSALAISYFVQLGCLFVGLACSLTAALMQKSRFYADERNARAIAAAEEKK